MSLQDDFKKVKAMVFDIDGVLSSTYVPLNSDGELERVLSRKDDYILGEAARQGFVLAVITACKSQAIRAHYMALGFAKIYLGAKSKLDMMKSFRSEFDIPAENILYMGDDLPDYQVLKYVGLPTCPADAVPEVKKLARYISTRNGGRSCVREVVEKVFDAQNIIPNPLK